MEVSLKEYIESRMDEREKVHVAQLETSERSLELAASALREKLEGMNQFRHQIDNERALYVRRDGLDALVKMHNTDIERLTTRLEKLENWQSNVLGRQLIFGGAIIVISAIVTAALRLVGH